MLVFLKAIAIGAVGLVVHYLLFVLLRISQRVLCFVQDTIGCALRFPISCVQGVYFRVKNQISITYANLVCLLVCIPCAHLQMLILKFRGRQLRRENQLLTELEFFLREYNRDAKQIDQLQTQVLKSQKVIMLVYEQLIQQQNQQLQQQNQQVQQLNQQLQQQAVAAQNVPPQAAAVAAQNVPPQAAPAVVAGAPNPQPAAAAATPQQQQPQQPAKQQPCRVPHACLKKEVQYWKEQSEYAKRRIPQLQELKQEYHQKLQQLLQQNPTVVLMKKRARG